MSNRNGVGSFILGGLIGAGIALLFAPRTGKETREFLSDKVLEYWENADEVYETGRERAVELYATGRDVAVEATDQVKSKIDAARARLLKEVGDSEYDGVAAEAEMPSKKPVVIVPEPETTLVAEPKAEVEAEAGEGLPA